LYEQHEKLKQHGNKPMQVIDPVDQNVYHDYDANKPKS